VLRLADPFADASGAVDAVSGEDTLGAGGKVHIRIQQRNGRKCITTVAGLSSKLHLKKIQKAIKKEHCCNGTVLKDEETGQEVMQFQGDQREAVKWFLLKQEICNKDNVKVHGFYGFEEQSGNEAERAAAVLFDGAFRVEFRSLTNSSVHARFFSTALEDSDRSCADASLASADALLASAPSEPVHCVTWERAIAMAVA